MNTFSASQLDHAIYTGAKIIQDSLTYREVQIDQCIMC